MLRLGSPLAHIGPGEVAHRVRRLARKRLRGAGAAAHMAREAGRLRSAFLAQVAPLPAETLAFVLDDGFLFGPQDRSTLVAALSDEQRAACLRLASGVYEEGITLLGHHHRLEPGAVRWCSDPESGATWPDAVVT